VRFYPLASRLSTNCVGGTGEQAHENPSHLVGPIGKYTCYCGRSPMISCHQSRHCNSSRDPRPYSCHCLGGCGPALIVVKAIERPTLFVQPRFNRVSNLGASAVCDVYINAGTGLFKAMGRNCQAATEVDHYSANCAVDCSSRIDMILLQS
jgi:hypothetical protein